jgi:XTP/dITP diphosphohydrolase
VTIYCATTNQGKVREYRLAFAAFGGARFNLQPLSNSGPAYEESGLTFAENAAGKAVHYSRSAAGAMVFADDSGLEVDALGGAPGIYSARFAGPGSTDAANNALLVERLAGVSRRSARFVCEIAVARDGQSLATFRGTAEGEMLSAPRGAAGFGYDPLFFYPPRNATFAELTGDEKLLVSHRGAAVKQLVEWLS